MVIWHDAVRVFPPLLFTHSDHPCLSRHPVMRTCTFTSQKMMLVPCGCSCALVCLCVPLGKACNGSSVPIVVVDAHHVSTRFRISCRCPRVHAFECTLLQRSEGPACRSWDTCIREVCCSQIPYRIPAAGTPSRAIAQKQPTIQNGKIFRLANGRMLCNCCSLRQGTFGHVWARAKCSWEESRVLVGFCAISCFVWSMEFTQKCRPFSISWFWLPLSSSAFTLCGVGT